MSIEIYDACIPLVANRLRCLSSILKKGEAFASERKVDDSVMLGLRLAPDMFALGRQIQVATDNAKGIAARLAGVDVPSYADDETTFEQLQARLEKTLTFVESLDREKFEGAETREIVLKLGPQEIPFTGESYLFSFALPNFLFHAATAYGILRHAGVPLTKGDFLRPG